MEKLTKVLTSPEFTVVYMKALAVISLVLLFFLIALIIKNKMQKKKAFEFSKPQCGEIRNNKIYCNLTDPVYTSFRSRDSHSTVQDHINVELESDLDECIGIKYYALSRNGRFLIHLNGSDFWVEPSEYYASYEIHPKRKEENH